MIYIYIHMYDIYDTHDIYDLYWFIWFIWCHVYIYILNYKCNIIYIYIHIRRPLLTAGGARQRSDYTQQAVHAASVKVSTPKSCLASTKRREEESNQAARARSTQGRRKRTRRRRRSKWQKQEGAGARRKAGCKSKKIESKEKEEEEEEEGKNNRKGRASTRPAGSLCASRIHDTGARAGSMKSRPETQRQSKVWHVGCWLRARSVLQ